MSEKYTFTEEQRVALQRLDRRAARLTSAEYSREYRQIEIRAELSAVMAQGRSPQTVKKCLALTQELASLNH